MHHVWRRWMKSRSNSTLQLLIWTAMLIGGLFLLGFRDKFVKLTIFLIIGTMSFFFCFFVVGAAAPQSEVGGDFVACWLPLIIGIVAGLGFGALFAFVLTRFALMVFGATACFVGVGALTILIIDSSTALNYNAAFLYSMLGLAVLAALVTTTATHTVHSLPTPWPVHLPSVLC